ncbi:uncharacterized protein [Nicotiana sylvestris]|uniref:uncharacterized protein n=1 Tax=Nicotiana sylvestris TaxID=4096 RepID=UPI00388C46BA
MASCVYCACAGLCKNMQMRPPLGGELEASIPSKGKKRKDKTIADLPPAKEAQATRASSRCWDLRFNIRSKSQTKKEDDDECQLARRTWSNARASQVHRLEAAKSKMAKSSRSRELETLEEGVNAASNRTTRFDAVSVGGTAAINHGDFQEHGLPFGEISNMGDFISCFQVLSGELGDAQDAKTTKGGIPLKGEAHPPISSMVLEITSLSTFLCKKLTSMLRDLEAHSARGEKELGELRVALERALWEKAILVAQVEQNGSLIRQLNTKISELRKRNEVATGELATSQDHLKDARKEVALLASTKSKVEQNAATYLEDESMMHKIVHDISIAAEQKLTRAINLAKAEARRETLEEIGARGVHLSADLEEDHKLERELALLIAPDEGKVVVLSFKAFDSLKSELLCSEAPLREALDKEKSLKLLCVEKEKELLSLRRKVDQSRSRGIRLEKQLEEKAEELGQLWGKVGRAKREFNKLQAHTGHANDSARVNMITRLSSELSKAKTKAVNVEAKVVMSNTGAGQKVEAYSKSAAVANAELKRTLDRASNSKEYARCRSRREVLEEIHARGFDISGDIEQAKREEYDAKFLLSDAEDGDEGATGP